MFREAAEAGAAVARQLRANCGVIEQVAGAVRTIAPRSVVTCGRGSSDHAATYAKYLIEIHTGLQVSSAAPSVSSVYAAQPDLRDVLFIAISQSGKSPDLVLAATHAREAGALVLAFVNSDDSPLGSVAHHRIPLHAGIEASVAATKSYIASLAAILHFVSAWTGDAALGSAVEVLPDALGAAWSLDWSAAIPRFRSADSLYVVGRGLGLGIAQEAALKFKEACGLHAEAFSAAELRHGPMALVKAGFPVLVFVQDDETRASAPALVRALGEAGADVVLAGLDAPGSLVLPALPAHPAIGPILLIQSFYRLAVVVALARGRDPDRPPHLSKVTETV